MLHERKLTHDRGGVHAHLRPKTVHGRPSRHQHSAAWHPVLAHRPQVCICAASTTTTFTRKVFEQIDEAGQSATAGGAGGSTTWNAFLRADEAWNRMRNQPEGPSNIGPPFVTVSSTPVLTTTTTTTASPAQQAPSAAASPVQWDVAVCGGTLGVFLAASLAQRGLRVVVLERGALKGRQQEWNISRKEMHELVECGLLTAAEVEHAIVSEFNPVRVGFKGTKEVWTRDVLNCGVNPDLLIQLMRSKLEARGGQVLDNTPLQGVTVHSNGVVLRTGEGQEVSARLVIDCMGHQSPIVRQARGGRKPDGVCIVVGTLASGFTDNTTADVIYTNTDLQPASAKASRLQLFWEAFPAASGPTDRTTYMFTYMDAASWRPSMIDLFEEYWPLMAQYQNVRLEDLKFKRALFGLFPTFRDSPLKPAFDRVLQVGDASGIQSPLSFGGFGALTRHLKRLTSAISEALECDALDKEALGLIHAYNPGLSSSWMLQRAMSVRQSDAPAPNLINKMLGANFQAMEKLGEPVLKPFLQDVIQLGPLLFTMTRQMLEDPGTVPQLIMHVGPGPLLDWTKHVGALAAHTALYQTLGSPVSQLAQSPMVSPRQRFELRRQVEAWQFGAGLDYKL